MRRLVINADDFGLHPAIDEGILEAKRHGILTSASVLITATYAAPAIVQGGQAKLGLGLHLALSGNLPCAANASRKKALAKSGRLPQRWTDTVKLLAMGAVRLSHIETELRAQIDLAQKMGLAFDHFDSHQHLHVLPGVRDIVCQLALEFAVPIRWPAARLRLPLDMTLSGLIRAGVLSAVSRIGKRPRAKILPVFGLTHSGQLESGPLVRQLGSLPEGDFELMCHPGRDPGVVTEDPTWRSRWLAELSALTSDEARAAVASNSIELTTYRALFSKPERP